MPISTTTGTHIPTHFLIIFCKQFPILPNNKFYHNRNTHSNSFSTYFQDSLRFSQKTTSFSRKFESVSGNLIKISITLKPTIFGPRGTCTPNYPYVRYVLVQQQQKMSNSATFLVMSFRNIHADVRSSVEHMDEVVLIRRLLGDEYDQLAQRLGC